MTPAARYDGPMSHAARDASASGPPYMVGEEVLCDGERYVVAGIGEGPYPYRLLATHPEGARIRWAAGPELSPLRSYTEPRADTDAS